MRRENFGSYLTIDNRGERIRLFIPPKPPVSSDLAFSAEERKSLANTLFCLGRLEGTTKLSEIGEKLWNLTKVKELSDSLVTEGLEPSVYEHFLGICDSSDSGVASGPGSDLIAVSNEFERHMVLLKSKRNELRGFWSETREGIPILGDVADRSRGFLGRGSSGLASVPPPEEEIQKGLENLLEHLFQNRLKLDPIDSIAIFFGMMWMLNPFGIGTGLVARSISLALLGREGLMNHSVIGLSQAIIENAHRLHEALSLLRNTGDWEAWIAGFAELLSEAARKTESFNLEVSRIYLADKVGASALGRPAESIHRIIDVIFENPVFTSNFLVSKTGLTPATVNKSLQHMVELSVIRETTSKKRGRVFQHEALMKLFG